MVWTPAGRVPVSRVAEFAVSGEVPMVVGAEL